MHKGEIHTEISAPPDLQSGGNGIANADTQHDGIANAVEQLARGR